MIGGLRSGGRRNHLDELTTAGAWRLERSIEVGVGGSGRECLSDEAR